MATAPEFTRTLSHLNDREKLMLIDAIADTLLDEGAADELAQGLGAAFERIELTYANAAQYPFGNMRPGAWAEWRRERNAALAYRGVSL